MNPTIYRVCLAGVPAEAAAPASVLVLEDWQQAALEAFVADLLTERQRRELDEAVIDNLAHVLERETAAHLEGTDHG